ESHIYCNERTFSSLEYADQLYSEVSAFIREKRNAVEEYPVYITDIDLPYEELAATSHAQLQTVHYLNYKQRIEEKLNV
ncbi:hypothetical protein A9Q85_01160, partial [Cycloclasticus sp. 44_32_T64]